MARSPGQFTELWIQGTQESIRNRPDLTHVAAGAAALQQPTTRAHVRNISLDLCFQRAKEPSLSSFILSAGFPRSQLRSQLCIHGGC